MSKYIKVFNLTSEYDTYTSGDFLKPNVSYCKDSSMVYYNQRIDYSKQPLTFVALEDGTFKFSGDSINYSLDSGSTWTTLASNTNSPTVSAGQQIMWKATLTHSSYILRGIGRFRSTASFTVEGNAMSLLYGDNYIGQTDLSGKDYAFYNLFDRCTGLISAENLSLPATTLADDCYFNMFYGCTSLTTAPSLPATTLAEHCYASMFYGCTSLTTAPSILPATTLAYSCYVSMFFNCRGLTTAPQLPATTLNRYCYRGMFQDCTSLTTAPQLPATTLVGACYADMFNGCTSLTTAPTLSATTLVGYCYSSMFQGCTNLNSITCLATNISAEGCTRNWVGGVAASGTFIKDPSMSSWSTDNNGIPYGWTVEDYTE